MMRIRFEGMKILQTVAITALLAFAPLAPASAQNSDTNARMQRIENEIQTLSRAIFKGETPPPGFGAGGSDVTQANMLVRLDQIENDLRTITGKIEEQSYELGRLKDLEGRLMALENRNVPMSGGGIQPYAGVGMSNQTVTPGQTTTRVITQPGIEIPEDTGFGMQDPNAPATTATAPTGQLGQMGASGTADPVTVSYEAAYAMLRNQDYPGAEIAFSQFIKAHPDHALVPNAMYWLGETHYVRGDFQKAAFVFAESYQKYPKGAKAPDNLLKLGMALAGMGKVQDACVALGQLKKEYPAGSVPVLTRGEQERSRLGCK